MKTKTVIVHEGENVGPINWSFDFDSFGWDREGCVNPECVKSALSFFKELRVGDKVYMYGMWEEVVEIGMYDGWPFWKPVPSFAIKTPNWGLNGKEWHSFEHIRNVKNLEN